MQVKFLTTVDTEAGLLPAGTIVDHPDCYLLADLGLAVEHDEEATAALAKWREAKRQAVVDPRNDTRFDGFRMAGRDVPTVFTLPGGETLTVSAGRDGRSVVTNNEQPTTNNEPSA